MITKSAKEKRRAERRREVAASRTAAFERAYYAHEDEKFLSARDRLEMPKSCLNRPESRLDYVGRKRIYYPSLNCYLYAPDFPGRTLPKENWQAHVSR